MMVLHMNKKTFTLVFLLIQLSCMLAFAVAEAGAWGEIRYADRMLNIRAGRSAGAEHVKTLQPHDYVKVDFIRDGWCAVFDVNAPTRDESKAIGYAKAEFLQPVKDGVLLKAQADPDQWGEIRYADRNLNVREARDRFSEHVRTLYEGDKVKVDFLKDEWIAVFELDEKVRDESKAIGYANAKYLKPVSGEKTIIISATASSSKAPSQEPGVVQTEKAEPESASSGWGEIRRSEKRFALKRTRSRNSGRTVVIEPGTGFKTAFLKNGWYAVFKEDETIRDEKRAIGYVSIETLESPEEEVLVPKKAPLPMIVEKERIDDLDAEGQPPAVAALPPVVEPSPAAPAPALKEPAVEVPAAPVKTEPEKKMPPAVDYSQAEDSMSPKADTIKHGYKYKIVEKTDALDGNVKQLLLRIFLDVDVLPEESDLKDFATTIWKTERQSGKEMLMDIYLPGMNMRGLSYIFARFNDQGLLEFWTRDTVLFGTKFMN